MTDLNKLQSIDDAVKNDLILAQHLADKRRNRSISKLPFSSDTDFEQAKSSAEYHLITETSKGRVRSDFGDSLPVIVNGRILDIGSCKGETTEELSERYKCSEVIGIDINPENIAKARDSNKKAQFMVANGYCPHEYFPARSFDAVFMMNNLLYAMDRITDDRLAEILGNVKSVIKPGGYLCISAMNCRYVFRVGENSVTLETPLQQIGSVRGIIYGARLIKALDCAKPEDMKDFEWLLREGGTLIRAADGVLSGDRNYLERVLSDGTGRMAEQRILLKNNNNILKIFDFCYNDKHLRKVS